VPASTRVGDDRRSAARHSSSVGGTPSSIEESVPHQPCRSPISAFLRLRARLTLFSLAAIERRGIVVVRQQRIDLSTEADVPGARGPQEGVARFAREAARLEQDLLEAAVAQARVFGQGDCSLAEYASKPPPLGQGGCRGRRPGPQSHAVDSEASSDQLESRPYAGGCGLDREAVVGGGSSRAIHDSSRR
jgi:hypothetical protein